MGRFASFNTGFEQKFVFAQQPSDDILCFGGCNRNSMSPDIGIVSWDADIDVPIIKKIFANQVQDVDLFLENVFDGISQDLDGTHKLQLQDAHDYSFLNLGIYDLGICILHQLLQKPKLVAEYER